MINFAETCACIAIGLRRRVLSDGVVGHHQDQQPVIERGPTQDVILTERPVLVQALFQVDEIAALTQAHLLREAGQLIQVRRKISYTPNSGLR